MKTKECINQVKSIKANIIMDSVSREQSARDFYGTIVQELEVLEILRKYLSFSIGYENGDFINMGFGDIEEKENKEDFDKVKEWLIKNH